MEEWIGRMRVWMVVMNLTLRSILIHFGGGVQSAENIIDQIDEKVDLYFKTSHLNK